MTQAEQVNLAKPAAVGGSLPDETALAQRCRNGDDNTTDSKVELRMFICNVDQLPPRQTTTVNIESADPEKSGGDLQGAANKANGRVVEQSLSTDGSSRMHVVIDVPLKNAGEMLDHVRGMGTVKRIDQARDTSVPEADFVHARLDVTFATINPIVGDDTGIGDDFAQRPVHQHSRPADEPPVHHHRPMPGVAVGAGGVDGIENLPPREKSR